MPPSFPLQAIVVLSLSTAIVLKLVQVARGRVPYPPGPPGAFIFGNALQIPKSKPWLKFTEWGIQYGNIVFARIFSRKLFFINSYDLAVQLFAAEIYSDRPQRRMAELSGFNQTVVFMNYGEGVRKSRRLIHGGMSARDLQAYQETHTTEARMFAKHLLEDPAGFRDHIDRVLMSSFLEFTYGQDAEDESYAIADGARKVVSLVGDLSQPNKYAVDIFPILEHLPEWWPGAQFKKMARANRQALGALTNFAFARVQGQMLSGTARPSFVKNHLEKQTENMKSSDMESLKWTAIMINGAGLETTASVLSTFFLAMARNPEIQERAQEEIERTLGTNVLPSFADRERLPFVECLIKETYRWHPPIALSSRSVRRDDIVNGFLVPAGSFLMANIWAFTHDPQLYGDGSVFNPERFVDPNPPPDPRLYIFGFGRRRCPGNMLADNFIYIMVVTVLALFNVSPEVDEEGMSVVPEEEYTTGLVSHPAPFRCKIVPRSQEAAKLVLYANDV